MLTSTNPRDLVQELRTLMKQVGELTDDAIGITADVECTVFLKGGVVSELSKLPKDKEPDGMPGPAETALGYLEDLKRVADSGAELERIGGEIWERLDRIVDLLESSAARDLETELDRAKSTLRAVYENAKWASPQYCGIWHLDGRTVDLVRRSI